MKIQHDPSGGCDGCPFQGTKFSTFCDEPADADNVCNATSERGYTDHSGDAAPEWCPLRSGGVLVTRPV